MTTTVSYDYDDDDLRGMVGKTVTVREERDGVERLYLAVLVSWSRDVTGHLSMVFDPPRAPAEDVAPAALDGIVVPPTWSALTAGLPEPTAAIAKLHRPADWIYESAECQGCEMGVGHGDRDYPAWPCETAQLLLDHLGIPWLDAEGRYLRANRLVSPERDGS